MYLGRHSHLFGNPLLFQIEVFHVEFRGPLQHFIIVRLVEGVALHHFCDCHILRLRPIARSQEDCTIVALVGFLLVLRGLHHIFPATTSPSGI